MDTNFNLTTSVAGATPRHNINTEMKMKSLSEICKTAGLKFGRASEGAHVEASQHEPTGYWIKDGKTAIALEPYADQMEPEVAKRVRRLAELHRNGEKIRAEREKQRQAERQAQASAELDQKLIAKLKLASPAISKAEIEALLPELRKRHFLAEIERQDEASARTARGLLTVA